MAAAEAAPAGRPSSFRWIVLAGGCVAQASFSAFFLGLPALAPAFRDDYGLDLGETALLLASASIGIVLTLFPWGVVTDRTGESRAFAAGLLGAGAAVLAAAAELGGPASSGAAIGVQQTALARASSIVPLGFAVLVARWSWQAAFAVAAFFPLVGWYVLRPLDERRALAGIAR